MGSLGAWVYVWGFGLLEGQVEFEPSVRFQAAWVFEVLCGSEGA